jgi:eukaryotic-like serine/threonine-protein kinase
MQGIADFEFIRPLGSGTNGQYFVANRPPRLPGHVDQVAVKVLGFESTAETFRRASRELKAFAAVSSANLAALYDVGQHDGVFYYSMEYVPGGSLAQPAQQLDQRAGIRAVADAANAVADLHDAGLVHRDLKPGNLLLGRDGVRLSDPALSQLFAPGVMLTGMGSITSVEYSDPDLLHGEPAGPHNDVWSLGVLLHRVVAGVGVYGDLPSADGLAVVRRILSGQREISRDLPDPIADVVGDCLASAPQRPPARVVADRLATVLA